MHDSVLRWVQRTVAEHDLAMCSVLEVGSYDVNGSVRQFFHGPYTGIDTREGPGVDKVADAHDLPFGDNEFEVVVSTEMLEHDPAFWLSVPEMVRVLVPGGWLLVTARGIGFAQHDFPSDYWRFTPEAFRVLLAGLDPLTVVPDPDPMSPGVFGCGRKET